MKFINIGSVSNGNSKRTRTGGLILISLRSGKLISNKRRDEKSIEESRKEPFSRFHPLKSGNS